MKAFNRVGYSLIVFSICTFLGWASYAQILSLPPQEHEKIRGFKIGSFRLVPLAGVQAGWDSNIFRQDKSESPKSAGLILPQGGLKLHNPNGSKVYFSLAGIVDYRHYFSNKKAIEHLNTVGATADMELKLFPRAHFGADIHDTYKRSIEPRNYSTNQTLNHHENTAALNIGIRPGGGVLDIGLFYVNTLVRYDDYKTGDFISHKVGGMIRWDFLPKTSMVIDAYTTFFKYSHSKPGTLLNVDSDPLVARIGLVGYITAKLILDLRVGFTKGFYDAGNDYTDWTGQAIMGYKFTPSTLLEFGYKHYYEDSYYSNYYGAHRVYLSFKQQFWQKFNIEVGLAYNYLMYGPYTPATAATTVSTTNRRDSVLEAGIGLNFSILRYLALNVQYKFYGDFTDFSITTVSTSGARFTDKAKYTRNYIMGGLRLYY